MPPYRSPFFGLSRNEAFDEPQLEPVEQAIRRSGLPKGVILTAALLSQMMISSPAEASKPLLTKMPARACPIRALCSECRDPLEVSGPTGPPLGRDVFWLQIKGSRLIVGFPSSGTSAMSCVPHRLGIDRAATRADRGPADRHSYNTTSRHRRDRRRSCRASGSTDGSPTPDRLIPGLSLSDKEISRSRQILPVEGIFKLAQAQAEMRVALKGGMTRPGERRVGYNHPLPARVRSTCGKNIWSHEIVVSPPKRGNHFSQRGDSGAMVTDRHGRVLGVMTGGEGMTQGHPD